jgi:Helix-turn-helix domain
VPARGGLEELDMPLSPCARRKMIFGEAPAYPLDRNAKHRVWSRAKGLSHWNPTLRCRLITPAAMRVLECLLWRFHDADGCGRCFPSYEAIAKVADCCRDTVCGAIRALEQKPDPHLGAPFEARPGGGRRRPRWGGGEPGPALEQRLPPHRSVGIM